MYASAADHVRIQTNRLQKNVTKKNKTSVHVPRSYYICKRNLLLLILLLLDLLHLLLLLLSFLHHFTHS